jgi:hypothetical protein
MYLASLAFLPLGLRQSSFLDGCTATVDLKKGVEGDDFPKDHAYYE